MSLFRNLLACIRAFVCVASLASTAGWAASSSVNPSADAFVAAGPTGNLSNNNYGGAGAISIAAPNLSQGEFQSVGQWFIQSVTLQLTATAPNNAIFNASAAGQLSISWMQNDGWTEGTGTPQAPTPTGLTFSTLNTFLSPADEALGTFNF